MVAVEGGTFTWSHHFNPRLQVGVEEGEEETEEDGAAGEEREV